MVVRKVMHEWGLMSVPLIRGLLEVVERVAFVSGEIGVVRADF